MISSDFRATPYTPDRADDVRRLFRDYPYKRAQKKMQKLNAEKLNALYFSGLSKAHDSGQPTWLAENSSGAIGAAGIAPDPWHSEVYGLKMGKIQPWLNFQEPEAGNALLDRILKRAREDAVEHLSVRIDAEEFGEAQRFERAGFQLIDVSLKFSLPMPFERKNVSQKTDSRLEVRLAEDSDREWMRGLGARAHAQTHFLNDPNLPRDKTRELFERWVERCVDRLAYRIYVLLRESQPIGFVIYLRNQGMKKTVGVYPIILDYVILDPETRGTGGGPLLIAESLSREADAGFDYCELRTSIHNHAAIGCYEKLGFRICASDFVLHKSLKTGR